MNKQEQKTTGLRRITDSRIFWMVVSLLVAAMLWFYVTSTEGVVTTKDLSNIRIEFLGADALREANDLIVTEQDVTSVDLTLSGTRRVLGKLSSSNVSATIDLSRNTTDGRYSVSYELRYPSGVNPDDITVTRSSTDIVNFYLDKISRKTIEVQGVFSGNTAEGYMENGLLFDPLVVPISGPKTAISKVDHAFVAITREGVDKTLSYSTTYELVDRDNNPVDDTDIIREIAEINVTLSVLSTRSVPLDVTIINGGGATREENVDIDIKPASILLAGDAEAIDSTSKLILGTIDLSTFSSTYSATYTIVPPNNTENLTGATEATVTLTIVGLSMRSFDVNMDNVTVNNIPDGYDAEIVTQSLSVNIRAPESVLDQIQTRNIRAVADLADITNPTSNVYNPALRILIDGFPEAGVVGESRIYVTLKPAAEKLPEEIEPEEIVTEEG